MQFPIKDLNYDSNIYEYNYFNNEHSFENLLHHNNSHIFDYEHSFNIDPIAIQYNDYNFETINNAHYQIQPLKEMQSRENPHLVDIDCDQSIQSNNEKEPSLLGKRRWQVEKPLFYTTKISRQKISTTSEINNVFISTEMIKSKCSDNKSSTYNRPFSLSFNTHDKKYLFPRGLSIEEKNNFHEEGLPNRIWEAIDHFTWNDWRKALIENLCSNKDQAHKILNILLYKKAHQKVAYKCIKGDDYANVSTAQEWQIKNKELWNTVLNYCNNQKWIDREFEKLTMNQWKKILLKIKIPVISIASNKTSLKSILNTILCKQIKGLSMAQMDIIAKENKAKGSKLFYSKYAKLKDYWFPILIKSKILEKIDSKINLNLKNIVEAEL